MKNSQFSNIYKSFKILEIPSKDTNKLEPEDYLENRLLYNVNEKISFWNLYKSFKILEIPSKDKAGNNSSTKQKSNH